MQEIMKQVMLIRTCSSWKFILYPACCDTQICL